MPELTSPGAFLRKICTTWCLQNVRCLPEITAFPKMNFKPEKLKSVRQYLVSKQTWCLMSTETIRFIRDREKGGKRGIEVGEGGDYILITTLSLPE